MGLMCNGYRLGFSPFRYRAGALVSIYTPARMPAALGGPGALRGLRFLTDAQAGLPQGNLAPASWMLPQKAGGMSMRSDGDGDMDADLIPTRAMAVDLSGEGLFDATAALVVTMAAALAGAGALTASIVGRLDATIDLAGAGSLQSAMDGVATMVVDMLGIGDVDATISAIGDMSIDIVVTGAGLTTANIGQAVWSALASAFNEPGTLGAKLNAAAAGGVDLNDLAAAVWAAASRSLTEPVDANVASVNGVPIIGAGTSGDKFRV